MTPTDIVVGAAMLSRLRAPFEARLALAVPTVSLIGNMALLARTDDEIPSTAWTSATMRPRAGADLDVTDGS